MFVEYEALIQDAFGNKIKTHTNFVDPTDGGGAGLDYVLNVGKPSVLLLTLPLREDPDRYPIDGRIMPMRSIGGRGFYNDNQACYLIRKKYFTDSWFRLTAYHANELLDRRAVAYNSGTSYAQKAADNAGDQIKAFARENIGSSFSAANRDGTDDTGTDLVTPGYLVIEADKGDGASIAKNSDRGSLLGVIQDTADASLEAGTYMSFNTLYNGSSFRLETHANQWGVDRRANLPNQLILSPERGNLENWTLEYDYADEVTVAIAGGRGQNDIRIIQVAYDTTRMNISPFNRRERYYDVPNGDTAASVLAGAQSFLAKGNPKINFSADLVETTSSTRGIHFDLGDIVTARVEVHNRILQFDCRIDTIYVSVRNGEQNSRVELRSPL